jgi:hypothetical protein
LDKAWASICQKRDSCDQAIKGKIMTQTFAAKVSLDKEMAVYK